MTDKKGYYAILHLSENAGEKEIKEAFRREVKLYHPDKNPDPKAKDVYLKLNEAYQVLTDPDARKAYDNVPEASADFIPCCCCGKHARQPRYVLFEENGVLRGGVFLPRLRFKTAVPVSGENLEKNLYRSGSKLVGFKKQLLV